MTPALLLLLKPLTDYHISGFGPWWGHCKLALVTIVVGNSLLVSVSRPEVSLSLFKRLQNDFRVGWEIHSRPHEQVCLQGNGIQCAQGRLANLSGARVQGEEKALSSKRRLSVQHLGAYRPWTQVRFFLSTPCLLHVTPQCSQPFYYLLYNIHVNMVESHGRHQTIVSCFSDHTWAQACKCSVDLKMLLVLLWKLSIKTASCRSPFFNFFCSAPSASV